MKVETRMKKLMDIRKCAIDMEKGSLPPAAAAGLLALVSTVIILGAILKLDPFLAGGTGFVLCLLVYFRSPLAKSWAESLDNRLTDYEPIDHEAYAALHHATRQRGGLDLAAVFSWIEQEMIALSAVTPRVPDGAASKFINKAVKPEPNQQNQE